eukprot:CAMPEP_0119342738 /NCGR_PEP_ID=MMETSP1333-20130426/105343_1 /TAXON_ID=418940 /ORGANISM="Scyphosphaera apsteinii, Strain RCC1455" /LENGTH=48 /DNA_ID= /DNA_START= /DNA_END= /DNA_ORIENTATION=
MQPEPELGRLGMVAPVAAAAPVPDLRLVAMAAQMAPVAAALAVVFVMA